MIALVVLLALTLPGDHPPPAPVCWSEQDEAGAWEVCAWWGVEIERRAVDRTEMSR